MRKNIGTADRALRVVAAAGAVAGSGVLGISTAWGIVLLAVAAVMVATALSGYCPIYSVLHVETTGSPVDGGEHRNSRMHRAA